MTGTLSVRGRSKRMSLDTTASRDNDREVGLDAEPMEGAA